MIHAARFRGLMATLLCLTSLSGTAAAQDSSAQTASAGVLFLKPTYDNPVFVIDAAPPSSSSFDGRTINNEFGLSRGYRLSVGRRLASGHAFTVTYTTLKTAHDRTVSGPHLYSPGPDSLVSGFFANINGTASSTINLWYHRVGADFSTVWAAGEIDLSLRSGMEFAYLQLNEDTAYSGAGRSATIEQRAKNWGLGPEVGLGLDGPLLTAGSSTLSVHVLSTLSLLVAQSDHELRARASVGSAAASNDLEGEQTTRMTPAIHARAGLSLGVQLGSVRTRIDAGYEVNSYLRALRTVTSITSTSQSFLTPGFRDFGLHGLYLTVGIEL